MNLKIMLPFQIFTEIADVLRMTAETSVGSLGILPQRLDCVASIVPGILSYETKSEGETFIAVDEGVLIKTGQHVLISVRRALGGVELGQLRDAVRNEYLALNEQERSVRNVMAKLETGLLRRFADFQNE